MLSEFMWERFLNSGSIEDYLVFKETAQNPSHDV